LHREFDRIAVGAVASINRADDEVIYVGAANSRIQGRDKHGEAVRGEHGDPKSSAPLAIACIRCKRIGAVPPEAADQVNVAPLVPGVLLVSPAKAGPAI